MHDETDWRQKLSGFAGNDPPTLIAICDAFLEEVPILIRQIRSGWEDPKDEKTLQVAAHTLKSCFRYVAPDSDIERAAEFERGAANPQAIEPERLEQLEAIAARWCELVGELRAETIAARE
ncbi:Hpt domain protein [Novipirellula aureliae]|uniref:Hpt domain protein n=1 Tax=Novipirellula aureliae TaxID=2527966 RepID=A0A5C6DVT6_9BACT|nr:Hpt domain-containing protein [Novipirellula aureliae]TWU38929.1 Hpt domain protein [Novipirellula aureliae]